MKPTMSQAVNKAQLNELLIEYYEKKLQVSVSWISVEDELPTTEELFMVYPEGKYNGMFASFWPHKDFKDHKENTFEYSNDDDDIFEVNVTHWSPLLKPPTK